MIPASSQASDTTTLPTSLGRVLIPEGSKIRSRGLNKVLRSSKDEMITQGSQVLRQYPGWGARAVYILAAILLCLIAHTASAIVDLNANGMSDVWEMLYGTGLNPAVDLDGTGMTNLEKSIAGLNPYNSSSVFSASVTSGTGSNLLLSWPSVLGKQYQIQSAPSLTGGTWTGIGTALAGTGALMTGTVTRTGSANFYNISVSDVYDTGESPVSNWEALQLGLDPTNAYSNGYLNSINSPLTNYQYVSAALTSTNTLSIAATDPIAAIPVSNPATSTGLFTITRGGNLNAITVSLAVNSSAIAGSDYASLPASCTFPVGVNSVTIPVVPLAGSSLTTPTPLTLSVKPSAAYTLTASGSATVFLTPPLNIAPMTWTTGTGANPYRSDWINVMTSPNMTIHATGNGTTDDTAALQQALNLATTLNSTQMTVYLPAGTYKISSTLFWDTFYETAIQHWGGDYGLWLVGCGSKTKINWAGPAGGVMFLDQGSSRSHYEGIVWNAGASGSAAGSGVAHLPDALYQTRMRHENEAFLGFVGASGSATLSPRYSYTLLSGTVSTSTTLAAGIKIIPLSGIPAGLVVGAGIAGDGIGTGTNGLTTMTVAAISTSSNSITLSSTTNHTVPNGTVYSFCSSVAGTPETVPAAGIFAGSELEGNPMAETMIWNCLFQNDTEGVVLGYEVYNDYMWIFKSCEFDNCGIGINSPDGDQVIMDTHFSGSTIYDVTAGGQTHLRRCTSTGSRQFFVGPESSEQTHDVIEDCWVDGWTDTTTGAISFNDESDMVFDCTFTHPPAGSTGVIYMWPPNELELTLSNNYIASTTVPLIYQKGGIVNQVNIPAGGLVPDMPSPNQTFLQSAWPADGATILDITQPPYNAVRGSNCTTAIQNAINQAKTNNNGTIVYIPVGTYDTNATLNVTGSNYTIEGSGFESILAWSGTTPTTAPMIQVSTPQSITLEQFRPDVGTVSGTSSQPCISETSSGISSVIYDEVLGNNPGIFLTGLPAGSYVFMPEADSGLVVNDCGPAVIFSNYLNQSGVVVTGASHAKTGFLGALAMEGGLSISATNWDVIINDNQDFVSSDYYNEQSYNHLLVENTDGATWTGRVTIQGMKEEADAPSTSISIQNYGGRVFYGPQSFNDHNSQPQFLQSGAAAVDLVLIGCNYYSNPNFAVGSSCTLIEANDICGNPQTYMTNVEPTGWGALAAAGLDHIRQDAAYDLYLNYGWLQAVNNPSFETDPLNSALLTTLGTAPAQWTVLNAITSGTGVRDVCAVTGASPFASGSQCAALVDTTGTSSGSPLQWSQTFAAAWSATQGGVFTFDCQMNPVRAGITSNLWVKLLSNSGGRTPCSILLAGTGSNTTWQLAGPQGGLVKSLATLTVGTWYRFRAVIPPPATGGSVTLYVTPWTTSGPGATSTYTLDGETAISTTGFNQVSFALTGAGQNTDCNIDNVTLNSNPIFALP